MDVIQILLSEILDYLRIKIGLSASLITLLGYTLNNGLVEYRGIILVAGLFMTIAVYSYNFRTDVEEDKANGRIVNKYGEHNIGAVVSVSLAMIAIFISLSLSIYSLMALIGTGVIGFCYSVFNWKMIPHLKNISIALGFLLVHLFGILAAGNIGVTGIFSSLVIFFVIFGMGLLADLRDVKGDATVGIPTYPVIFGLEKSKLIVEGSFLLVIGLLIVGKIDVMKYLLPFVFCAIIISRTTNNFPLAHHYMRSGVILISMMNIFI